MTEFSTDFLEGFEHGRFAALSVLRAVREEVIALSGDMMNPPAECVPDRCGLGAPEVEGLRGAALARLELDAAALQLAAADRFLRVAIGHVACAEPAVTNLRELLTTLPGPAGADRRANEV